MESTSVQPEASSSHAVRDEDDQFWISDDIPGIQSFLLPIACYLSGFIVWLIPDSLAVDAKNCLDNVTSKGTFLDHFVKPPANLVVLEGDCLDSTDDGGELESYLVALFLMHYLEDAKIL